MQSSSLRKIWRANRLYMPYMAGTSERNFNRGGGPQNLHGRCKFVEGGGGGSPDFLGLEMVFSTFSTRYFSAKTQPG